MYEIVKILVNAVLLEVSKTSPLKKMLEFKQK